MERAAVPPGLEHLGRFGHKHSIEEGWRVWLARRLGRDDLAGAAPASIAATALDPARGEAWFATPVHLIASLTSLHLDRRSLLRLSAQDLATLADDFNRIFADADLTLTPIDSNGFLIRGLENVTVATTEPARALAGDLGASLPAGPGASVLKRLGAELEMWLHDHPVNQARARRGELPVSTLWLWGGGPSPRLDAGANARTPPQALRSSPDTDLALGSDPYLIGLWHLQSAERQPLPDTLPKLSTTHPSTQRTVIVTEVTPALHANPQWTIFEVLADLDRRFLVPALTELREGTATSVVFIANDTVLHVQARDRLKFWRRRPKSIIEVLRP
jgi:hypothetical protein